MIGFFFYCKYYTDWTVECDFFFPQLPCLPITFHLKYLPALLFFYQPLTFAIISNNADNSDLSNFQNFLQLWTLRVLIRKGWLDNQG